MGLLCLPGDPGFEETLLTPRPDWGQKAAADGNTYAFVVGEDGLARPATSEELEEYMYGGEYDERMAQIDELE
ncbi:MAG: hypothetical protein AAFN00_05140 [Cyanobacteria bacterium J06558_2]